MLALYPHYTHSIPTLLSLYYHSISTLLSLYFHSILHYRYTPDVTLFVNQRNIRVFATSCLAPGESSIGALPEERCTNGTRARFKLSLVIYHNPLLTTLITPHYPHHHLPNSILKNLDFIC